VIGAGQAALELAFRPVAEFAGHHTQQPDRTGATMRHIVFRASTFLRIFTGATAMTLAAMTFAVVAGMPRAGAQSPATPQYDITKVTNTVYSFRFFVHRNMILLTSDGVIVTDPINPLAAKIMMGEIGKLTNQPVKLVIYSHDHWDHISGAKIFKDAGAKIIQHALAAEATRTSPNVVLADETFSGDKHVITLGDQTVELIYVGSSHGSGMVVMRVPKERVLHTIDVVTPGRVAFRNMPDFYPQDWIKALRKMEQLDFDIVVPGHGPPSAPKSAVTLQREYLEELTKAVSAGTQKAGNPFAFDKITESVKADLRPKYGKWAQFEDWMILNVDRIILEQRIGW
jgi:glyoxylase-like metal-dependent hydrolase (beta-lactamase superfamily II)